MRRLLGCALALLTMSGAGPLLVPAQAAWSASGTGSGTVEATTVDRATAPVATIHPGLVDLSWASVMLDTNRAVDGYDVVRHVGSAVALVCTVSAPLRSCTDSAPVAKASYGVVARHARWVGPESPLTSVTYDVAAPLITVELSPAPNPAGWSRTAVTVTLSSTDAVSGVASVDYRVDGGPLTTIEGTSASLTISGAGVHDLQYAATDRAGNTAAATTRQVRIDPTAPLTSLSSDAVLNTAGWSTAPVNATLTATDAGGSGVVSLTRTVDDVPGTVTGATAAVRMAAEGTNALGYSAVDAAGNTESVKAYTVKIDTVAPVTAVTSSVPTGDGWTNSASVALTVTPSDATSGVASWRWRTGTTGTWTSMP